MTGLTGLAGLVAGCETNRVYALAKGVIVGFPEVPVSRESVDRLPYAQIHARIGTGPRATMVLAQKRGEETTWVSADKAAVTLRHGRVIRTAGLPDNLKKSISLTPDPLEQPLLLGKSSSTVYRILDTDSSYGVRLVTTYSALGREVLTILGRTYNTIVIQGTVQDEENGPTPAETYWIDETSGFVWKSRQMITDNLPTFEYDVLKPAA